jgi:hypothetical protein
MAIAANATATARSTNTTDTTVTAALTIPNGNLNNVVWAAVVDDSGGSGNVTGCTWNGNAMTQVPTNSPATFNPGTAVFVYLFYYAAGTGDGAAHNVVATRTTTARKFDIAVSCYSGGAQTGIPDNSTSNTTASASSLTSTLTPNADNCWGLVAQANNRTGGAGTGSTIRASGIGTLDYDLSIYDTNAAIHPAASTSMTTTITSASSGCQIMVSFAPPAAAAATVPLRSLLGVGI